MFIQIAADAATDVPIPDQAGDERSTITFGVLKAAQSLGDRQALLDMGRYVIRFELGRDPERGLEVLVQAVSS